MRLSIVFLLGLCLAGFIPAAHAQARKTLDIYVVDVEGGNATLFVTPSGESVLIDTGNGGAAAPRDAGRIMAAVKDAGLTEIDNLITTHWHGGATNLTVSSWVYSTNFNQNAIIINKETTNSDWNLFFESGHIKLRGGSSSSTVITAGLPSNNAWHNVVGTISGTTGTIYVDGVQQSSGSVAAVTNSQNTLDIGRYGDSGGGYYFSGLAGR